MQKSLGKTLLCYFDYLENFEALRKNFLLPWPYMIFRATKSPPESCKGLILTVYPPSLLLVLRRGKRNFDNCNVICAQDPPWPASQTLLALQAEAGSMRNMLGVERFWRPVAFFSLGQQLQLQEGLGCKWPCVFLKSYSGRLKCLTGVWVGLRVWNLLGHTFSEVSKNGFAFKVVEGKTSLFQEQCCRRSLPLAYVCGTRTRELTEFYQGLIR